MPITVGGRVLLEEPSRRRLVNDYLSLLPTTLAWIAERLDRVSPIPWPFWIGGLFPLYLAALADQDRARYVRRDSSDVA
jgi:hypothetical protein